ncbi:ABC transporter ATP-binding protein [Kamptonema cortianum]|nr:ABC transporter ATP-binding protein [Kamptonema cortianum]
MTDTAHPVPESDTALIRVEDVSYRYGAFMALTSVSLRVGAGELIALIGRNGAGKSTLLRCIAGWTHPTDGEVHIMGRRVRQAERWLREHVVLVPDKPPFYDELTAWEHLQFIAQAHGVEGWHERAEMLLDRYGLINNRDAFPFAFSRGMQYKLALCMGLLIQPRLLLLDEPLGPLDPVSADDLWYDLNALCAEGMSILISSHQLPQDAHPHRYLVMENGEVIAEGTPDAIREQFGLNERFTLDDMLRSAIRARRAREDAEAVELDEAEADA